MAARRALGCGNAGAAPRPGKKDRGKRKMYAYLQKTVDLEFEKLAGKSPDHFAVRQYLKYKMAAGNIFYKRHLKEHRFNQIVAFFLERGAPNDRPTICCPV